MKISLIVLLLTSLHALADKPAVAFGVENQADEYHLLIHDFNEGNLNDTDAVGLQRYGFGRGQLEIGNLSQIYAENRSGFMFGQGLLKAGLEPVSGKILFHNTLYYQWEPGISIGIGERKGDFTYYLAPRTGFSYATNGNDSFLGAILCLQYKHINASYLFNDYNRTNDKLEITDIVINNKYNIQYKLLNQTNPTYIFGIRF